MLFASPLWLFGLLPWTGVVLFLLWGRRRKTNIPFLDLWRGPALHKPAKRRMQPPPGFLALAMIAMLLAVLSAAGPGVLSNAAGGGRKIVVIIDRGIGMSALAGGRPQFQTAARQAVEAMRGLMSAGALVEIVAVPGETIATDLGAMAATVDALAPTALDTRASLIETVRDQLAAGENGVVVITDEKLPMDDRRVIQFAPQSPVENIGIVQMAAREQPAPQVMVRVNNDSSRKTVSIEVTSGARKSEQSVQLPVRGQERDYFFDLPKLEPMVEAAIKGHDDQPADDRAWLIREGSFPKVEVRTAISPSLQRMFDVYTRSRPANESSGMVAIVGSEADLPSDAPAVLLMPATHSRVGGAITTAADAVTADVDWTALAVGVQTADAAPRGWTPLVSVGNHVIVAQRPQSPRQIYIGFDSPIWAATSDFVVFWGNVLTWTGAGHARFAAYPLSQWDAAWKPIDPQQTTPGFWPGVYQQTTDGSLRAYNAPELNARDRAKTTPDWKTRLQVAGARNASRFDLAPPGLLLALACLVLAALTWKVSPRPLRMTDRIGAS